MAYDPNDPADKATVQALIDAAVEAERDEAEQRITALDNKNKELLSKLKKARAGNDGSDTGEIERLESELDGVRNELRSEQAAVREANRKLKAAEGERDTFRAQAETEGNFSRSMLTENSLTAALVEANVAPHFMDAARALLSKGVTVEVEGDTRTAKANGKTVAEYVKEWATSDAGKHYVQAPANGGGGATNANGGGGGSKKLADMSEQERLAMARTDPTGFQALVAAEGNNNQSVAA